MAINVKDFSRQITPGFKAIVDILEFNGWRGIYEEQDIIFRKKRGQGEIWLTPFFSDEIIDEVGESYIRDVFGDDAWEGMKRPSVIYMPENPDEDEPITIINNLTRASVRDINEALGKLEDLKKIEVYESTKAGRSVVKESDIRAMVKKCLTESLDSRPLRTTKEAGLWKKHKISSTKYEWLLKKGGFNGWVVVSDYSLEWGFEIDYNGKHTESYDYIPAKGNEDDAKQKIENIYYRFEELKEKSPDSIADLHL